MKLSKYLILLIISNCLVAQAMPPSNSEHFIKFLKILGKVESNSNDFAIGDDGKAISRYQVWKSCYLDAKQFDKSIKFSYESLTNKENADKVVYTYLKRYSKSNDYEEWARLWNSGPGWQKKKQLTDKYWQRFYGISRKM